LLCSLNIIHMYTNFRLPQYIGFFH
jgi:hypothetical protein